MGLLSLFRKTPSSANLAKERLRIIVAQERSVRGAPDYLPLLRRELLEVIHKYVNVDLATRYLNCRCYYRKPSGSDKTEPAACDRMPQRARESLKCSPGHSFDDHSARLRLSRATMADSQCGNEPAGEAPSTKLPPCARQPACCSGRARLRMPQ